MIEKVEIKLELTISEKRVLITNTRPNNAQMLAFLILRSHYAAKSSSLKLW